MQDTADREGGGSVSALVAVGFVALFLAAALVALWLLFGPEPRPPQPQAQALGGERPWFAEEAEAVGRVETAAATGVNVVLFVIDTLRADHLSCYGYHRKTSPNIDALAAEGIVFENHKSQSGHTVISMTSMFSSRYTLNTGLGSRAGEYGATLPEAMKAAGYYTAGIQTNPWLDSLRGFARGFEDYYMLGPAEAREELHCRRWTDGATENVFYADGEEVYKYCEGILKGLGERPLFLYVHMMDVHGPYMPPVEHQVYCGGRYDLGEAIALSGRWVETARGKSAQAALPLADEVAALYDGEIRFADSVVGRVVVLLKEKGIYDNTLFIVAADHGEAFLEHGLVLHSNSLYEELLRLPLVMKAPGRAAARYEGLTRNVDIAPTVFEAAGVKPLWRDRDGVSLFGVLEGGLAIDETVARMNVEVGKGLKKFGAIQQGSRKYIWSEGAGGPSAEELYDLEADAGESVNLAGERPAEAEKLSRELATRRGAQRDLPEPEMDADTRAQLEALGYLN